MLKRFCHPAIALTCLIASLTSPCLGAERPSADYVDPLTGMEFMAIPGGSFIMGSKDDDRTHPLREVTIKPFLFGRYEVTFDQYAKFCADTGRLIPADNGWGTADRPVINVTWEDAISFTKWLSEKAEKPYRLPSEAEWEFAARGGAATSYPWGDEIGKTLANCNGCGSQWDNLSTAPVGSFAPNGYGLYDVVGNVYEYCLDGQAFSYEGAPSDGSPRPVDPARGWVISRGGSWKQPVREMPVTRRCWEKKGDGHPEIGFRVLLERPGQ